MFLIEISLIILLEGPIFYKAQYLDLKQRSVFQININSNTKYNLPIDIIK